MCTHNSFVREAKIQDKNPTIRRSEKVPRINVAVRIAFLREPSELPRNVVEYDRCILRVICQICPDICAIHPIEINDDGCAVHITVAVWEHMVAPFLRILGNNLFVGARLVSRRFEITGSVIGTACNFTYAGRLAIWTANNKDGASCDPNLIDRFACA